VNGRITALTGALCGPDSKIAVTLQSNDTKGKIEFRAKEYNGSLYIIAAQVINLSGSKDTQQATITVPGLTGAVTVYDENRTITPAGTSFSDKFIAADPAHIYVVKSSLLAVKSSGAIQTLSLSHATCLGHRPIVTFGTPENSQSIITIYSCSGTLLRTFGGTSGKVTWDCTDESGKRLASGVYYAAISGGPGTTVLPVLLQY
jgi:hypothetical protein